ncbi:hypothetical protein CAPTEDRAFT_225175 [Capitella teleta]|uniref:Pulmonary surfactant-associated protein B n=1 Tax=Capitella teleta TaxID=283909 RepID=R7VKI2_CAPTE|nr:hypothetical protein CAPTEDRAFT_225175 [Capitella teleta]|eukprot:ELU16785.1 hypothetical protein CAPTEDRAFT_225175 [Capitella teleta]
MTRLSQSLDADHCTLGPSFWCSSIANSKQCNAFDHCVSSTWKNNEIVDKDTDEVCQFCETVVGEVKSMLLNKKAQDEVRQFLDSACSVIPSAELAKECASTVDKYLEEILGLIAMEMDPQMVCSLMGLCTGLNKENKPTPQLAVSPVNVEPLCTDCKKFFEDIKAYITSASTEKEIEEMIDDQLCTNLGGLEDECKQLVKTFLPEILQALAGAYDPDIICDAFGLCLNSSLSGARTLFHRLKLQKTPLFSAAKNSNSAETCMLCETVVGEVQTLTRDAATQAEIEAFLKTEVCAHLGSVKDACEITVDSYGSIFFEFLANELDPKTRCTSLGFCLAASNEVSPSHVFSPLKAPALVKASTTCVVCEFVMSEIDSLLSDNATEEDIKIALEKVCKILPETIQDQCMDFVNMYSDLVINLLTHELNPEQICTAIGLCRTAKSIPVKAIVNDAMCSVCETVIQYVDTLLEENSTIAEIEAVLEKVCNFLPTSLQQQCDTIIETYGKTIVQMIVDDASPEEICTAIGLCTSVKTVEMVELIKPQNQLALGTNECTYGPSFWCASKENAVKCNTVAHCEKHGWLN